MCTLLHCPHHDLLYVHDHQICGMERNYGMQHTLSVHHICTYSTVGIVHLYVHAFLVLYICISNTVRFTWSAWDLTQKVMISDTIEWLALGLQTVLKDQRREPDTSLHCHGDTSCTSYYNLLYRETQQVQTLSGVSNHLQLRVHLAKREACSHCTNENKHEN